MSNIDTGFGYRKPLWAGLGTTIDHAPTSEEAIQVAGLDWNVIQEPVYTFDQKVVPGFRVNIRDRDRRVLGMVTERYHVIQNHEAFAFTDNLLGEGVTYETAGSLASGKRVWMLARLEDRDITDEIISPYLVFTNSHDGTKSVQVAITPVRVICQNTLNLALKKAERSWSCSHRGDIQGKLKDAEMTLLNAETYLGELEEEFGELKLQTLTDDKVWDYIKMLVPIDETEDASNRKIIRLQDVREEMMYRYQEAPDLRDREKSAFRFVNAISDFATHSDPIRHTANFEENRFMKTIDGNALIDKAYKIVRAA